MAIGVMRRAVLLVALTATGTVATRAAAQTPSRVGVYTLDEGQAVELAEALDAAAEQTIAKRGDVTLVKVGELAQPTHPTAETLAAIQHADDQIAEADVHFAKGEMDEARHLLEDALQTYQRFLPEVVATEGRKALVEAWTRLTRARYFAGDRTAAQAALQFVFALAPQTTFSKERFGVPLERMVNEAKLFVALLGQGKLAPDSDPPGAEVLIDGKAIDGRTPLGGVMCTPGPHYVTFRRRGYVTQTAIFAVQGDQEKSGDASAAQPAVRALERVPLLRPLYRVRAQLDSGAVDLSATLDALGVDQLVLLRAVPSTPSPRALGAQLTLHAYAVGRDGRVAHAQAVSPEASAPLDVGALVERVLSPKSSALVAAGPSGPSAWQRFRRWPGFWYVVGGVAAVAVGTAIGVGVGVGARSSTGEQVLILGR